MTNRPCPRCQAVGRDKKGDHLFLLRDGITWACLKPYHRPYYERDDQEVQVSVQENIQAKIEEIKSFPFYGNQDRKISPRTHERFKVRTEFSEEDASTVAIYYPETHQGKFIGYKQRILPKKFFSLQKPEAKGLVPDFFGQHCCPMTAKRILITGGEEDALAAYEMLYDKYPDAEHAIVSLSRGEGGTATVAENLEFLKGFEEVIIGTDMDQAGRDAVAKIAPIIGERARVLVISEKDISDMLVKGKQKEFFSAYYQAREYRPSNIVGVSDILEKAVTPRPWGLSYPFKRLTELTYGMKEGGEIISIGSGPGSGKTTFVRHIQEQLMFVHQQKIAVFDLEDSADGALNHLIGGMMNLPIHLPDCKYDIEEAKRLGRMLEDKVYFYEGLAEDWEEVKDNIRYFASKGIRFYFIDPLSSLVEHLSASEAYQELGKIMRDMKRFRKQQGLTFFSVNHLNNPTSGKDHGAGGDVYGSQFSGSRHQWKYSTALWGIARDQLAETEEDRNKVKLSIIKDRLGGKTGHIYLQYNSATGKMEELFDESF